MAIVEYFNFKLPNEAKDYARWLLSTSTNDLKKLNVEKSFIDGESFIMHKECTENKEIYICIYLP